MRLAALTNLCAFIYTVVPGQLLTLSALIGVQMFKQWLQTLGRCTCLIVDLMFSEMLLQLALGGKDLRAYRALLVLELSIAETFCLGVTGICIFLSARKNTSIALSGSRGLLVARTAEVVDMLHFLFIPFSCTGAIFKWSHHMNVFSTKRQRSGGC